MGSDLRETLANEQAFGFAVRQTVESYSDNILLSLHNLYEISDFVDIGGHRGNVVKLTFRTTTLLSPDGNRIRIPSAMVFNAVIVIYTRDTQRHFEFDNFIFDLPADELAQFVALLRGQELEERETFVRRLVEVWGVRRTSPQFWSKFQDITDHLTETDSVEAGILDLNRYIDY